MTKARIQPLCRSNNINLGYFAAPGSLPKSVTDRIIASFLYNHHFCLIWKPEKVSFNQTFQELKHKFKIVDNFILEENVNSHFEYEFIPKKIESHPTKFFVCHLETLNSDRARPYCISFYRLGKLAARYNLDSTPYQFDKCKKVFSICW